MQVESKNYAFVTVDDRGAIVGRGTGQVSLVVFDLGLGQCMEMVSLTGGVFLMGSPFGEGYADEKPQHRVSVQPFLIGRFPVSQA